MASIIQHVKNIVQTNDESLHPSPEVIADETKPESAIEDLITCNPPKSIVLEDGSVGTVIAEAITETDDGMELKPVAMLHTEHGYSDDVSGTDFSRTSESSLHDTPAARVTAKVAGVNVRQDIVRKNVDMVPLLPMLTYEWRVRRAQKKVGKTLLSTMGLK